MRCMYILYGIFDIYVDIISRTSIYPSDYNVNICKELLWQSKHTHDNTICICLPNKTFQFGMQVHIIKLVRPCTDQQFHPMLSGHA